MGYTHYWQRKRFIEKSTFKFIVKDFRKVLTVLNGLGVELAGPDGSGSAIISDDEICFNGLHDCGHERREMGIAWPAKGSSGICLAYEKDSSKGSDVGAMWFAGRELLSRTCDGDCSHETFSFPISTRIDSADPGKGHFHNFCKTAFKPYDLAVQVCLVIASRYLRGDIVVNSDGDLDHWRDAVEICKHLFGYGGDFSLG